MPLRLARLRTGLRRARALLVALAALAPALAGPGALVASLALLAAGDAAHAHHLSVRPDVGHDDIVLCHEGAPAQARGPSLGDATDCPDDHRFHVTSANGLVAGSEARSALRHDGASVAALPRAAFETGPAARSAPRAASSQNPPAPAPLERSAVLQI